MSTIKTLDEYISEAAKHTDARRAADIKQLEDRANENIKTTNDFYNKAIDNAKVGYESDYQKNAVQKIINQQKIAEKNASLGLTDSGLNRTQQTATQLSYANQKGNIDIARRTALDELNLNLASAISSINQELEANKLSVNQSYDQLDLQTATNMRNADIEAEQANIAAKTQNTAEETTQEVNYLNDRIAELESKIEILQGLDYSSWNESDWESYFAQIRNSKGKAAAEKELQERRKAGDIPQKYLASAAIGARGKLGH